MRRQVQRLEAERGDRAYARHMQMAQMAQYQQSAVSQQALAQQYQQAAYGLQSQGLAQYQQVIHDAAVSGVGLLQDGRYVDAQCTPSRSALLTGRA